jgi:DtxR family Mn-dependent transcriptional regulator
MTKKLSPSLEDYLEAAFTLSLKDGSARTSEISRLLKVSKPSVNSAVKILSARGLLSQERYGAIRLSPSGRKAGAEISGRHTTLRDFFVEVLGLGPAQAERDACRAEHALSPEALRRVGALTLFLKAPARRAILLAAGRVLDGSKP